MSHSNTQSEPTVQTPTDIERAKELTFHLHTDNPVLAIKPYSTDTDAENTNTHLIDEEAFDINGPVIEMNGEEEQLPDKSTIYIGGIDDLRFGTHSETKHEVLSTVTDLRTSPARTYADFHVSTTQLYPAVRFKENNNGDLIAYVTHRVKQQI